MELDSPNKSSSRAGRFKKKLVSEEVLRTEGPIICAKLAPFHELFISGRLSGAEFTACYLVVYLSHRFPGTWLGAKKPTIEVSGISWRELPFQFEPNILRRLEKIQSLDEIFAGFAFQSTPLAVNRAILEWLRDNYGLVHMFRIPKSAEVLSQQKTGRRCVTTIMDHRLSHYILGERDALSFTMHDLIHADHFYHHNDCYHGQLGFYGLLDKTIDYFNLEHAAFAAEFEYLIADMNAYAIHLVKCLKSAMMHYFSEDYFNKWPVGLNPPAELFALNTPAYNPVDMDKEIITWLETFRHS